MSITPEYMVYMNPPIDLAPVGENEYSVSEFMAVKQGDQVRGFLQIDRFDGGTGDFTQHVLEIGDADNFDMLKKQTNNARIALLSESHLNGLAEKGVTENRLSGPINMDDKNGFKNAIDGILNRSAFTQAASQEPPSAPAPAAAPGSFTVGLGKLGQG